MLGMSHSLSKKNNILLLNKLGAEKNTVLICWIIYNQKSNIT